jgi:hypothetical protein
MKTYREGRFLLKNSVKSKGRLDFAYLGEIIDEGHFQDELQSEWGFWNACTKRNDFLIVTVDNSTAFRHFIEGDALRALYTQLNWAMEKLSKLRSFDRQ